MKKKGPDSLEGLFIALICCLLYTLVVGAAGLSSMLFVACITRYNTDRNKAAFPFMLSNVLQAVSGPFAGYFANRFSVIAVISIGSILAVLGIGTCFFAEDITTVTLLWGLVFGTGFGLSTLLLPVIINDYFFKQRSKALGMCYLGSPLGFLIFPPIFELLLDKYGLSGTFLLLSGIVMHCIPLSMLLKQPNFKPKEENSPLNCGDKRGSYSSTDKRTPEHIQQLESEICEKNSEVKCEANVCLRRFSIEFLWNQNPSLEDLTSNNKQYVLNLSKKCSDASCLNSETSRSFMNINGNHYENLHRDSNCGKPSNVFNYHELVGENSHPKITDSAASFIKFSQASKDLNFVKDNDCKTMLHHLKAQNYEEFSTIYFGAGQKSSTSTIHEHNLNSPSNHTNTSYVSNPEGHFHSFYNESFVESDNTLYTTPQVPTLIKYRKIDGFSNYPADSNNDEEKNAVASPDVIQTTTSLAMYLNPVFILICVINGIAVLHFTTLTTVIIDFSRDQEIDTSYEKFIMMCISLTGAFGMLGFGWVTDGGYLARSKFTSLMQFIGCISTSLLPFSTGLGTLMIPLAIWCVCQSSCIPLIPAIIAEHIKDDMQTVAISACNVLSGPLYLIIPPLIGYFRDEKGSYDNIFYLLGALSFLNAIALFIIPCLARWRARS